MSHEITWFAVKSSSVLSVSGLDIQLEQSENNYPASKKLVQDVTIYVLIVSVDKYEPKAQWLRQVAVSRATWVQFLQGHCEIVLISLQPRPCCVALSPSMH